MSDARDAVAAILARDGLARLETDDIERLIALYEEFQPELAQLCSAATRTSEPAVIFSVD